MLLVLCGRLGTLSHRNTIAMTSERKSGTFTDGIHNRLSMDFLYYRRMKSFYHVASPVSLAPKDSRKILNYAWTC